MRDILLFVSLLLIQFSTAQTQTDTISSKFKLTGTQFYQYDIKLKPKQLVHIMKDVPEAYKIMKSARVLRTTGSVIGGLGGFIIGWQFGYMITDNDINLPATLIGLGIVVISIPFSLSYVIRTKKAVRIYNESLNPTFSDNLVEFSFGVSNNGIGFRLVF